MKLQTSNEPPFQKPSKPPQITPKKGLLLLLVFTLIIFITFSSLLAFPGTPNLDGNPTAAERCDMFKGEWVPNPDAPYYTNDSCWAIHEHQNCVKYGRPDKGFMRWRWKPHGSGCELPIFNPLQFLELVRGKSLAFVGDSVARNQMQSLICLLSRVEYPIDKSFPNDEYLKRWYYKTYDFTLAIFSSKYLVRARMEDPGGPVGNGMYGVHLDEVDLRWAHHIDAFDYVVISGGHWLFRSNLYYRQRRVIGCRFCQLPNVTHLSDPLSFRAVFRTAFRAILDRSDTFRGTVYVRTFAPTHYEGGNWDTGGDCVRREPFRSNETTSLLQGMQLEMYAAQVEEFRAAEREGRRKGVLFRLMDTTQAMLMRPDGHPSRYGHWPQEKVDVPNDCLHWCLPGPIDTWSDFLLEMMKTDGKARSRWYH